MQMWMRGQVNIYIHNNSVSQGFACIGPTNNQPWMQFVWVNTCEELTVKINDRLDLNRLAPTHYKWYCSERSCFNIFENLSKLPPILEGSLTLKNALERPFNACTESEKVSKIPQRNTTNDDGRCKTAHRQTGTNKKYASYFSPDHQQGTW